MDSCRTNFEVQLPFGYKFHPRSSEIFQNFLIPKLNGECIASHSIIDLDVYQHNPDRLPLNGDRYLRENEAYFFVPVINELLQRRDGDFSITTPNGGCWKIVKDDILIYGSDGAIGYKTKLEFYDSDGIKTQWKMTEYRTNPRVDGNVDKLMVCKLRLKVEEIYPEFDAEVSTRDNGEAL